MEGILLLVKPLYSKQTAAVNEIRQSFYKARTATLLMTSSTITPEKLRNLRVILNSTAMDILYYTSPLYRGEVSRLAELVANTLYKFKWFK